jgi:hypothetical protein
MAIKMLDRKPTNNGEKSPKYWNGGQQNIASQRNSRILDRKLTKHSKYDSG